MYFVEGGGACPVGGEYGAPGQLGRLGLIAVSAIRPNQEGVFMCLLCLSVRERNREREQAPESWRNHNGKAESLATVFWTLVLNDFFVSYDLLLVRF